MLPLSIFRTVNFAAANLETFAVYAALSMFSFFLVLFLQQVAGYSPLRSGFALLPTTIVMFLLSRYTGRLSARFGPRFFMSVGPALSAVGLALVLRVGLHANYFSDLLPGVIVFSLGLVLTVAPLTTTVLAGVQRSGAGIASAVNNAIARVAVCWPPLVSVPSSRRTFPRRCSTGCATRTSVAGRDARSPRPSIWCSADRRSAA